jgi:hypothetical protein
MFPQLKNFVMTPELINQLNKIREQIPIEMNFITYKLYKIRLVNAYKLSIKAALSTQYPHGIIYILENTLKQLQYLGLDFHLSRNSQYPIPS